MTRAVLTAVLGLAFATVAVQGCLFWTQTLTSGPFLTTWALAYAPAALAVCAAVAAGARRTARVSGRHVHRIEAGR